MIEKQNCRADLHVHSQYSEIEGGILKKITHSESYTPPREIYKMAKKERMDFVTITDHNSIRGALEIAHLEDVFISEEVTTKFPEDGCEIHLITLDINENQHKEITKLRNNIYELVDYLNSSQILHFVAHPFSSVNGRLKPEHWEKMLLLFDIFEVRNGVQREKDNLLLERILQNLSLSKIEELSERYKISPHSKTPWKKSMVGGSDDHGGLYVGKTYTIGKGPHLNNFLKSIKDGESIPQGKSGTFFTVGRSIYATGYKFYKYRLRKGKRFRFLDKLFTDQMKGEILEKIFFRNGKGVSIFPKGFFISYFIKKFSKKMPFLCTVRTIGKINRNLPFYTALSPYLFGLAYQNKDRNLTWKVKKYYLNQQDPLKIAFFVDTMKKGEFPSSLLISQPDFLKKEGARIICCNNRKNSLSEEVKVFRSVADFPFPLFPEIHLYLPPLLEILYYCEQEGFTLIHTLTPGPMGVAAILVSKILKVPLVGTYHLDFSRFIHSSTNNDSFKNMVWKYLSWYYNQMERILVTSEKYIEELEKRNIPLQKMKILPCQKIQEVESEANTLFDDLLKGILQKETFNQLKKIYEEIY